jgi:hypothetical protein
MTEATSLSEPVGFGNLSMEFHTLDSVHGLVFFMPVLGKSVHIFRIFPHHLSNVIPQSVLGIGDMQRIPKLRKMADTNAAITTTSANRRSLYAELLNFRASSFRQKSPPGRISGGRLTVTYAACHF